MKDTNRSLLLAALACLSMGLFAKSPQFAGGLSWITMAFVVATFALSFAGFWIGLRAAKQQRLASAWLAPGINALIAIAFTAFLILLVSALKSFN